MHALLPLHLSGAKIVIFRENRDLSVTFLPARFRAPFWSLFPPIIRDFKGPNLASSTARSSPPEIALKMRVFIAGNSILRGLCFVVEP